MECKVKVIRGPDQGTEFPLHPGENIIGRGAQAAVRLAAPNLSLEHAVLIVSGEEISVENLSAHGTWLNDEKIAGRTRVRGRDQIRLSPETVLRVEAADGSDSGLLSTRNLLWTLGVSLVLALLAALLLSGGDGTPARRDWNRAYGVLERWLEQQTAESKLPPRILPLFREGWRLDESRDFRHSRQVWLKLQIAFDQIAAQARAADPQDPRAALASPGKYPEALSKLVDPRSGQNAVPEAHYPAALAQFVEGRLRIASQSAPRSRFPM